MTTPVAIAIVEHRGSYLVGQRGPDAPLAGYFEFPGGKCLPGELPEVCAVRECLEETGLAIEPLALRREVVHTYPYGTVQLYFFDCRLRPGAADRPLPESFKWVPRAQLGALNFPEPNGPLLEELLDEAS